MAKIWPSYTRLGFFEIFSKIKFYSLILICLGLFLLQQQSVYNCGIPQPQPELSSIKNHQLLFFPLEMPLKANIMILKINWPPASPRINFCRMCQLLPIRGPFALDSASGGILFFHQPLEIQVLPILRIYNNVNFRTSTTIPLLL